MISPYSPVPSFNPLNITNSIELLTFMDSSFNYGNITNSFGINYNLIASNSKKLTIENTDIDIWEIP